jgi:hypothetical protein
MKSGQTRDKDQPKAPDERQARPASRASDEPKSGQGSMSALARLKALERRRAALKTPDGEDG